MQFFLTKWYLHFLECETCLGLAESDSFQNNLLHLFIMVTHSHAHEVTPSNHAMSRELHFTSL